MRCGTVLSYGLTYGPWEATAYQKPDGSWLGKFTGKHGPAEFRCLDASGLQSAFAEAVNNYVKNGNRWESTAHGITPGSVWLHENGQHYTVLYIANEYAKPDRRDEYPEMVVYSGTDGRVWAKTPEGFLNKRERVV